MPKRSNPWSDGPQQSKTHVGQMEVAHGVAGKGILDKIHENTKKLLVEGARRFYQGDFCEEDESGMQCEESGINNNIECTTNQKKIDSFFGLKVSDENKEPVQVSTSEGPSCRACRNTDVAVRCTFCEFSCCLHCLRTCSSCDQDFCCLCAVISYDERVERAYCLNCAG